MTIGGQSRTYEDTDCTQLLKLLGSREVLSCILLEFEGLTMEQLALYLMKSTLLLDLDPLDGREYLIS
jgi:hypothetical protein